MISADQAIVDQARRDGIAVLPDVLSEQELQPVRREFDQAHLDLGKGPGTPGVRDGLSGDALLAYPHLAAVYSHPRIIAAVCAILQVDDPWAWVIKTNRYTPEHEGVKKHSDGFVGEWAPPFTRQSMALFLDDIDEQSGALTYVPGSHLRHFSDDDDEQRDPVIQEQVDSAQYIPATLRAGSVILRVPEVWHAVNPIHRLRRYITASYMIRGRLSPEMAKRTVAERERRAGLESLDHVPERLRPLYQVDAP